MDVYEATIVNAAKLLGWAVYTEWPDDGHTNFVLYRGNQIWFVALKDADELEPAKQEWLDAIAASGAVAHIVYCPEGVDAFLTMLARPAATAIAAATVGRDSVLIDLDGRNVELIRQRLAENFRIVSELGNETTYFYEWTVETVTPTQLANHLAGQETLW
jgi:hypothetical protein